VLFLPFHWLFSARSFINKALLLGVKLNYLGGLYASPGANFIKNFYWLPKIILVTLQARELGFLSARFFTTSGY